MTWREAKVLYNLAFQCYNPIIEIGSWKGRSTVCLALASKTTVFAIDPHEGLTGDPGHLKVYPGTLEALEENLKSAKVDHLVRIIPHKSQEVDLSPMQIGLLFIDGWHSEKACKADLERFWPLVGMGGYVAIHDMNDPFRYPGLLNFRGTLETRSTVNWEISDSLMYGVKTELNLFK